MLHVIVFMSLYLSENVCLEYPLSNEVLDGYFGTLELILETFENYQKFEIFYFFRKKLNISVILAKIVFFNRVSGTCNSLYVAVVFMARLFKLPNFKCLSIEVLDGYFKTLELILETFENYQKFEIFTFFRKKLNVLVILAYFGPNLYFSSAHRLHAMVFMSLYFS